MGFIKIIKKEMIEMKRNKVLSLVLATVILSSSVALAANFTDLGNHWAKPAVDKLVGENVISGYGDGTFRPNNPITREESATLIAKFADPGMSGAGYTGYKFKDVKNRYSARYVDYLAEKGIVNGYGDGIFAPTNKISRENFATIVYRYAKMRNMIDSAKKGTLNDINQISSWAKEPVQVLIGNGIIKGMGDGTFKPKNVLTRAEAAQILFGLRNLSPKVTNYMVTNSNVVLMNAAKEGANPIQKNSNLNAGTRVIVEGYEGEYVLVRPDGIENASRGYVHKKYLNSSSGGSNYVKKDMVAIRELKLLKEPKADAGLIVKNNTLSIGTKVTVEGEATDYYLVRPIGIENASRGYVLKSALK